jgi:hypothetical protein
VVDLLVNVLPDSDLLESDLAESDLLPELEKERMLVDPREAEKDPPPLRASAGVASNKATARRAAADADAMVRVFIGVAPVCHPVWFAVLGEGRSRRCSTRNTQAGCVAAYG